MAALKMKRKRKAWRQRKSAKPRSSISAAQKSAKAGRRNENSAAKMKCRWRKWLNGLGENGQLRNISYFSVMAQNNGNVA
jgi:hypothetical protein